MLRAHFMALFDPWYTAIIVLDANELLNLHERSAGSSEERLDILENLSERIFIPRQFYDEYKKHLPNIANRVSRQYRVAGGNLQSYRDKTMKSLFQLNSGNGLIIAPYIPKIEELYQELIEAVSSGRKQHIARLFEYDTDNRIARLIDGKIGDPFPQSRLDSIYNEGRFRYNNRIPPGFKDIKKGEPDCYGDLVAWKQIIEYADETKRPVIMVTDDSSGEDWFYKSNGEPRGPRHELVQELRDQAGVDFYLYTSEKFMWLADKYLRWQRHVAAAGDYVRRHTRVLPPDFGRIAATGYFSDLVAAVSMLDGYTNSFSSLAGLTVGESFKGIFDSISAATAFTEDYKPLPSTMAAFSADVTNKGLLDSISATTAFADITQPVFEQQRRRTEAMMKSTLSDAMKNSLPSISNVIKDLTPSVNDSIMKQFREEQWRSYNNVMKNLSL